MGESRDVSQDTVDKLTKVIQTLKLRKQQRASEASRSFETLIVQWNQLKASIEEQQRSVGATSLISSSVDKVTRWGCLSPHVIEQVENEVKMLETWIS
ncbi:hypothetical protein EZV62_025007 [Acer yangbiense]|uniref:Uncharacterized protein n=1 Tax=Acer yangbiense TaxID=1000413 RepID=A0A5C7GXU9_9ROSI|nr:hypothetical protein EZV62_025007 [Acer yangbiense]